MDAGIAMHIPGQCAGGPKLLRGCDTDAADPQQFLQQAQNWRAPAEATDHGDKASQKDWLELISKGLTLANTLAGFFPQGGGGGGADQGMLNQSGWYPS